MKMSVEKNIYRTWEFMQKSDKVINEGYEGKNFIDSWNEFLNDQKTSKKKEKCRGCGRLCTSNWVCYSYPVCGYCDTYVQPNPANPECKELVKCYFPDIYKQLYPEKEDSLTEDPLTEEIPEINSSKIPEINSMFVSATSMIDKSTETKLILNLLDDSFRKKYKLKELYKEGFITKEEYERRKKELC